MPRQPIPLPKAFLAEKMDARVISGFTRVFNALLPAHDDARLQRNSPAAPLHRRGLFRRRLHLVVEINVILLVERLVAVEASAGIGPGGYALVGLEGLVIPTARTHAVRVFGA